MQKTIFFTLLAAFWGLACGCTANSNATTAPLPHSMKGYELYSWQAGGQWHFNLLTGTNRLKSLAEITTSADKVTQDGLVSASAQGVDALKGVLARLPPKEEIVWVSREQLEQAGIPAGNLALPPQEIIAAVQAHCQHLGLALYVHT